MKYRVDYDLAARYEHGMWQGGEWSSSIKDRIWPLGDLNPSEYIGTIPYSFARLDAEIADIEKQYAPVSYKTILRARDSKIALGDSKEEILAAFKRRDVKYFLKLARVLKDNPGNSEGDDSLYAGIDSHPNLMIALWKEAFLWMMTAKAGVEFFRFVLGLEIEEASYKMNRLRYKLFKHPDSPICGVRPCAKQKTITSSHEPMKFSNGRVVIPKMRPPCELVFRKGWTLTTKGLIGPQK